jgi:hypothetical protein
MPYEFNFIDLVEASRRVAPFWREFRSLRQELRRLTRQASLGSRSLQAKSTANLKLVELCSEVNSLRAQVERLASGDLTGKFAQLIAAIGEQQAECGAWKWDGEP